MSHKTKTAPCGKQGAAVTKACVDAADNTAEDIKTQELIAGWFAASACHRDFALRVAGLVKTNPSEAITLRHELAGRRRLARELRLAMSGGGR